MSSMHAPRSANRVDIHVGTRIRQRRQDLKMSQENLGTHLGVTFQQIQKYERGANRVGAGRLWRLAEVLTVPVSYFFEGLASFADIDNLAVGEDEQTSLQYDFTQTREGKELLASMAKIKNPSVRQKIIDLAKSLADAENG